jgi:hypothetical protein
MVVSAILELMLLSTPSLIYVSARTRHGHGLDASAVMGLRLGSAGGYLAAVGVVIITVGLGYAGFLGIILVGSHRALVSCQVEVTACWVSQRTHRPAPAMWLCC